MKKIKLFSILLVMTVLLAGCSFGFSAKDMTNYVQWTLENVYLGYINDDFMTMIDSNAEAEEATYLDSITSESDYFMYHFDIENATTEDFTRIEDFYKELSTLKVSSSPGSARHIWWLYSKNYY